MVKITAADVNNLRKITGAGMMDCKKALQESNGDTEKAIEILRKKGQKVASKRADKEAKEGVVIAKTNKDMTFAAVIMINCETDFVAKNADFIQFVNNVADKAIEKAPKSIDELKALGPASDPQPARLNHWCTRLDGEAAIFEALFNEDNLTIARFKQRLGNIFGVGPGTIDHSTNQTLTGSQSQCI